MRTTSLPLLFSLFLIGIAHGATIVVTQEGGIKGAIANAADSDTIEIPSGTYSGENNILLLLQSRTLTFISTTGDPLETIIECNYQAVAIAIVYDGNVTKASTATWLSFSGITFRKCGGYQTAATTGGGVLYAASLGISGDIFVRMSNCRFLENAVNVGGVIYASDESQAPKIRISLFLSDFEGNVADSGGVMYLRNGPLVSVQDCDFANNTADYGGVAYVYNTLYTVASCNFTDNVATVSGGVMYFYTAQGDISSTRFLTNVALEEGGAISAFQSDLDIEGVYFSGNGAQFGGALEAGGGGNVNIHPGTTFTQNFASVAGGAVTISDYTTAWIDSAQFVANDGNNGGGLAVANATVILDGVTFSLNEANWGGAIYDVQRSNVHIRSCTLSYNTADYGNSIFCHNSTISINQTSITVDIRPSEQHGVFCDNTTANGECAITPTDSGVWSENICPAQDQGYLTSSTTTGFPHGDDSDGGLKTWEVVLIVVCVVVGGGLIIVFAVFFVMRRNAPTQEEEEEDGTL